MDLTEAKRVTCYSLLTTTDFRFEIEEHVHETDMLLFTNIYMSRWAPSVRKRFHATWAAFRELVAEPIFAVGVADDDKFERFVRTLGFWLFQETVSCALGDRRLFVHTVPAQADNHLSGLGDRATNDARWAAVRILLYFKDDPQLLWGALRSHGYALGTLEGRHAPDSLAVAEKLHAAVSRAVIAALDGDNTQNAFGVK